MFQAPLEVGARARSTRLRAELIRRRLADVLEVELMSVSRSERDLTLPSLLDKIALLTRG